MTNIGDTVAELRGEQAREAVKNFRALLPSLNGYVRALTGIPTARVEPSVQTNGATDGKTIFIRPPISLGVKVEHTRSMCDKRDELLQLKCAACAQREKVLATIYHEIAHISYGSFTPVSPEDMAAFTVRAAKEVGTKYSRGIVDRVNNMPPRQRDSYAVLSGMVSPFLGMLVNSLEDARVNARMFDARRGTRVMFEASARVTFTQGVEQKDNTVKLWRDYPLNMQIIIGLYCKASGYDYADFFDPQIIRDLNDVELSDLCDEVTGLRGPGPVYNLSFKALARLRELGYCKSERDPEDEEPEDEPDPEPEAEPEPDPEPEDEPEAGEPEADEAPDRDESAPEPDGEPGDSEEEAPPDDSDEGDDSVDAGESGDDSAEPGPASAPGEGGDDPDAGSDEEGGVDGEAPEGTGDEEGAGSGAPDPEGDEGAGDPASDQQDGDGSDADSDGVGTDPDDPEGEDVGDEASSGTGDGPADPSEPESEDGEGDGPVGDEDGDTGGEPGDAGEPSGDGAGENPELGRGPADDQAGEPGEEPDDLPGRDEAERAEAQGDSDDEGGLTGDGEANSSGDDEPGEPGSEPMDVPGGQFAGEPVDESDSNDSAEAESEAADGDDGDDEVGDSGDLPDEFGSEDAEPIQSAPDDEGIRTDFGDADEIVDDINHLLGHDDHGEVEHDGESTADEAALKVAIVQGEYFETPSNIVTGVREHTPDHTDTPRPGVLATGWERESAYEQKSMRIMLGIDGDFDPSPAILQPALQRMRVAFSDNKRAKNTYHLKAGKVNARSLGKRAWSDDERLFKHKSRPGKRSYCVVIGVDISGSTTGTNLVLEKQAVMAQAELLNRMGITFAIIAHSANFGTTGRTGGIYMDMYHVKDFDEVWNEKTRHSLRELGPDAANLDGHSMEYYRKMLDRRTETDRIIMYYTDGKMPAENFEEELEILTRELKVCKHKGYTVMGVGINTDSPNDHGLDTVMVTSQEEVVRVVRHLEKRLES